LSATGEARLFAAVQLPANVRWRLAAWGRDVADVLGPASSAAGLRVLDRDSLHLTLSFLGERPTAEIPQLAAAFSDACEGAPGLELALGAPLWLPPRSPRALAVEVREESGSLASLQGAVELALGGERSGRRRFRPHVTVGRMRAGFRAPAGLELPVTPGVSFAAARADLIRSWLEPRGARYEVQCSVRLGAAPA
jgi:2'-5' RNA ligase